MDLFIKISIPFHFYLNQCKQLYTCFKNLKYIFGQIKARNYDYGKIIYYAKRIQCEHIQMYLNTVHFTVCNKCDI